MLVLKIDVEDIVGVARFVLSAYVFLLIAPLACVGVVAIPRLPCPGVLPTVRRYCAEYSSSKFGHCWLLVFGVILV